MTQLRGADISIAARNLLSPKRPGSRAVQARRAHKSARTPRQLHQFFERQCDVSPTALALICGTERLSYEALDARANRLARYLARSGIRPGDRVGLLMERSVHTYVSLLAVLKCGACFVPIDACSPSERVAFIAEDAELELLLTTSALLDAAGSVTCRVLNLESAAATIAAQPATRWTTTVMRDDLCYIMYTSGTTGRPKGVAIQHSSICNFLAVCTPIYRVAARDRVYQGMTLAFDFSIEEIWPTFIAGATLVAGPTDHRRFGPGLAEFLCEHEITVMCCVPTLLATVDRDVPTLHTLLVGGEACPADLVHRWSRPGRRMLNTYGPTETTVTATWCELTPGRAVTIGRPLPTYSVHILDDALRPVSEGEAGEVCIGGPGVAAGYVNRPELTADRFVPDPFDSGRPGARLYRTGDLGRLTPDGEIEYLGRIDSQVKIRGYRIELTEIEAVLLESAEVENALVGLAPGKGAVQELVAYIARSGSNDDPHGLKARLHASLRKRLPCYMVPAYIEILDALPLLASGKADRSRLPVPVSQRLGSQAGESAGPVTALEKELAEVWREVFGHGILSVEADFFYDLGGHSLFAAQVVSRLRERPALRHLGIAELYANPTIRGLARHIEEKAAEPARRDAARATADTTQARIPKRYGNGRVLSCGAVQMALLYVVFVLLGAPLALELASKGLTSVAAISVAATVISTALFLIGLLLPVAAKWLLIGRFRAGRYPLWGWYYCRWWLVRKLFAIAPLDYLAGSPLMPLYARLLGARIGADCHLGSPSFHLPDLIEVGDGASIGYGAELVPFLVEDGWLQLAPIRIDAGAFVGTNAVVMLGSHIGAGARLLEQSLAAQDQAIPDGETWAGSPSRRVAADPVLDEMAARRDKPARPGWSPRLWAAFIAGFLLLELLSTILFVPGLLLMYAFATHGLAWGLAVAPVAGLVYVLTSCGLIAAGKRLVMPTARPGIFPLHSGFGVRKWLSDKLMTTSLGATNSLYGTLYTLPWLRLLGAKIGSWAEVSTVSHIDPDLLVLGAESFVADLAVIGAARHFGGHIALGTTEAGARSFIGNAALVPSGAHVSDGSLIGVHSVPPAGPIEPGTSWLGSPAIFLPRRQICEKFDESVTFRPPRNLVFCRLAIEFLRVILPPTLVYAVGLLGTLATYRLAAVVSAPLLVLAMPGIYLATAIAMTMLVAGLKWLTVGRYRPRVVPLWSHFVWRTELITGLYENVAVPWLLHWLSGTPLMAPALRLFGARIGRRVYLETSYLTEFDLVHVGDDAAIGDETSLQTHLFEDRVMKMSTVMVGSGCAVGPRSVVLYDSNLAEGSALDAMSLVMKGEALPPNTRWRGIPACLVE